MGHTAQASGQTSAAGDQEHTGSAEHVPKQRSDLHGQRHTDPESGMVVPTATMNDYVVD